MEYFGATPEQFSWLVALNAVAMISMNLLNARLLKNVDATNKLIVAAVLLATVGIYLAVVASLHLSLVYVVVGVILYVGLLGVTAANAIAAALASVQGNNGVLQFGLGALASAVVSISVSVDATTMNYTMALCSLVTLFFVSVLYFNKRIKAVAALS